MGAFDYRDNVHAMVRFSFYAGMKTEKEQQKKVHSKICERIMRAADKSQGLELSVYEVYELAGHSQVQDES